MKRTYLDWAATNIPDKEINAAMNELAVDFFGNPSSLHSFGTEAAGVLEESRRRCARALHCDPSRLFFTSSGTEANNIILLSLLNRPTAGHIITSSIEHASCHEPLKLLKNNKWRITEINPTKEGIINWDDFEAAIEKDTVLINCMLLNNETGAIQPIRQLVETVRSSNKTKRPIHIHSDIVQAVGKIPVSLEELGIDSASISSHKFRGPRGAGLLYTKKDLDVVVRGGGQEKNLRPGTENLPAIFGMSLAMEKAVADQTDNSRKALELTKILHEGLESMKGCSFVPESRQSQDYRFSPYILTVLLPPVPGEVIVRVLDDAGFAISTGSACSANKKHDTRVLEAMGISKLKAFSSIRISIGPATQEIDIQTFIKAVKKEIPLLMRIAN